MLDRGNWFCSMQTLTISGLQSTDGAIMTSNATNIKIEPKQNFPVTIESTEPQNNKLNEGGKWNFQCQVNHKYEWCAFHHKHQKKCILDHCKPNSTCSTQFNGRATIIGDTKNNSCQLQLTSDVVGLQTLGSGRGMVRVHSSKFFPNLNFPANQKPPFSKNH